MKIADIFAWLGIKTDKRSFNKARDELGRFVKGGGKALAPLEKGISRLGKRLAGLVVGFAALNEVKSALNFSEQLSELTVNSQGAMGTLDQLREQVLEVSGATGIAREEVLGGAAAFVAVTGDGKAASASLETFAKVARATGAPIADVAKSAAAMSQNLDIKPEQFEKAFSILIRGGKEGAVELKDMASQLAKIAPFAAEFEGGKGAEGLAKLGSALQLIFQGTGSAAESTTALRSLITAIKRRRPQLEALGVSIFNEDGSKKSLQNIVKQIDQKVPKRDLIKVLGRVEAEVAIKQLTKVEGAWDKLNNESMLANDLALDFAARMNTSTAKVLTAWNKLRNGVSRAANVVVDLMAILIEHSTAVAIGITSITAAWLVLNASVIANHIRTAIAFAAAFAPVLGLAAVIAGIILVIQDLWTLARGGKSLIGEALGPEATEKFRKAIMGAAKWLRRAFNTAKDIVSFVSGDPLGARVSDKQKRVLARGRAQGKTDRQIKQENNALFFEENQKQRDFKRLRAQGVSEPLAKIRAGLAKKPPLVNIETEEERRNKAFTKQLFGDRKPKNVTEARAAIAEKRARDEAAAARRGNQTVNINVTAGSNAQDIANAVKNVVDAELRK